MGNAETGEFPGINAGWSSTQLLCTELRGGRGRIESGHVAHDSWIQAWSGSPKSIVDSYSGSWIPCLLEEKRHRSGGNEENKGSSEGDDMPIMRVTAWNEQYTHKILWMACERQADLARKAPDNIPLFTLTAMLMSFFALEGYVNFVGRILWPDEWSSRNGFFRRRQPPTITEKIKLIAKKVNISDVITLPEYGTVMSLKKLRNDLVHAKVEEYWESLECRGEELPAPERSPLEKRLSLDCMECAIQDVESFCNLLHTHVKAVSNSDELEFPALRGLLGVGTGNGRIDYES